MVKENPLFAREKKKAKPFKILNPIIQNTLIIGDPNQGKSVTTSLIAEALFGLRYKIKNAVVKIFDLFDEGRGESLYWIFPSQHPIFYHELSKEYNYRPRAYPVRFLFPNSRDLPSKLPIQSKVFTIPISSLTENDIYALVGDQLTPSQRGLWNRVMNFIDEKTTVVDLKNLMKGIQEGRIKLYGEREGVKFSARAYSAIIDAALGRLIREGMLSSAKCKTALDLKSEVEDTNVITVLVLKYCPPELRGFFVNYFIWHVFNGIQMGKIKKPRATYFIIREVARLLKSEVKNPTEFVIRENINYMIRQSGGPRCYFIMDTQYLSNLTESVKIAPERIIAFRTSEGKKIIEALGLSKGTQQYTREQIATLPLLKPRWCYVFEKGKKVFLTKMNIPRHQIWDRRKDDFEILYAKYYGHNYYNPETDLADLERENREAEEYWKMRFAVEDSMKKKREREVKEKIVEVKEDKEKEEEELEEEMPMPKKRGRKPKRKEERGEGEKEKEEKKEKAKKEKIEYDSEFERLEKEGIDEEGKMLLEIFTQQIVK
jgi:hypothetical protein